MRSRPTGVSVEPECQKTVKVFRWGGLAGEGSSELLNHPLRRGIRGDVEKTPKSPATPRILFLYGGGPRAAIRRGSHPINVLKNRTQAR